MLKIVKKIRQTLSHVLRLGRVLRLNLKGEAPHLVKE